MQAPLQVRNDSDAAQTYTARTVAQNRGLADNRPDAMAQLQLAEMMNSSPRVLQLLALSEAIHNSARMVAQRHEVNALFGGAVKPQGDGAMLAEASPAQREEKTSTTGLPNQLKSVHQCEFRDMGTALETDGSSVAPQEEQNDKELIYSQAFDKMKLIFADLTALEDVTTKTVLIKVAGNGYRVIIKKAPFGGKGSGAEFFTMELKRHVRKGKYRNFGKIVVKKMGVPISDFGEEYDAIRRKKQTDEIGTLDLMSSHPHAPTFHGATLSGDTYFVGMELADGDLSSKVERGASLASVSAWLRQTVQALGHLHENNRAHGDVKGDNVMISQKGNALLGDFGETENLDPAGGVSLETRYNSQKDDIKRYIQMVYKNLFKQTESESGLLTYLNKKDPKTKLDEYCLAAFQGSSNAENEPPGVTMSTLAGQLNDPDVWPE